MKEDNFLLAIPASHGNINDSKINNKQDEEPTTEIQQEALTGATQEQANGIDIRKAINEQLMTEVFNVKAGPEMDKRQKALIRLIRHENRQFKDQEELLAYLETVNDRFHNEDNIDELLEKADPEELATLALYHELSQEKLDQLLFFAQQRKEILEKRQTDIEKRKAENPEYDPEEKEIGAYREEIEAQVRDAVFALNRKGYQTCGSGYTDFDSQNIYGDGDIFAGFSFEPEFIAKLKEKNINLLPKSDQILFQTDRKLSQAELKAIWDEIVEQIPEKK